LKRTTWCLRISVFLVLSFFIFSSVACAGAKEKYQGKVSKQNIQLMNEPRDEYDQLQSMPQSHQQTVADAIIANSYAIYSTTYKAVVEEDIVDIKGTIVFEVISKGRTQIPLVDSSGVGLIEVSVNKSGAYVSTRNNKYYLIVEKPGKYKLDLEYLRKVQREREGGPGSFGCQVLPAPISEFEVEINEKDLEVFINNAIKTETEVKDNKTITWAIMPQTNFINVRWSKALPKDEIKPVAMDPKVYSTVNTFASAGEGILKCDSTISYSILQAEISGLKICLPDDVSVLAVNGRDLRDWKVRSEDSKQYLDIYFKFGIKGNYSINIAYEKTIGEGSAVAAIPQLKTIGVERETGFIGVASATNVELKIQKAAGATAIDVKELPSVIWHKTANPILLAFKYLKDSYDIEIEVIRHQDVPVLVATVDVANYITLNTKDGKRLTKALYNVRNNVKQFLRLKLPNDAELWSATVSGKPVKPAKDKAGFILIPLEKSQLAGEDLAQFPVEVVYLQKGAKMGVTGTIKAQLPEVDIPTSEAFWSMYLPKEYTYYNFGGDLTETGSVAARVSVAGDISAVVDKKLEAGKSWNRQYKSQVAYESNALDEIRQKGALPIKVSVPQRGKMLRFTKLLISEDESPLLTIKYVDKSKNWIKRLIIFVILVVIGLGILLKGFIKHKR
jgi:hypothetical protein